MTDLDKVIKGLKCCAHTDGTNCVYCPYDITDEDCTALMSMDVLDLLKEQEPKTGHWIFESQYCEAWSHTCSECGKRMTTGIGTYASYCWNCGAKMTGGEEK